jgi:hypothetical protein
VNVAVVVEACRAVEALANGMRRDLSGGAARAVLPVRAEGKPLF